MATTTYKLTVVLRESQSGEKDGNGEYYGTFWWRPEGGNWVSLASTTDSNPWVIRDVSNNGYSFGSSDGASPGFSSIPTEVAIANGLEIEIPTSSTFIEVRASIKEYDPTAFDADEDLGTATLSMPVNGTRFQKKIEQGNSSVGKVGWLVDIISSEYELSQMRMRF